VKNIDELENRGTIVGDCYLSVSGLDLRSLCSGQKEQPAEDDQAFGLTIFFRERKTSIALTLCAIVQPPVIPVAFPAGMKHP
jgi:hypothetical protein